MGVYTGPCWSCVCEMGNVIQSDNLLIVPYLRGYSHRAVLGHLWANIEEAGDWDKLFWESKYDENCPQKFRGDLVDWIYTMEHPYDPARLLMGIEKSSEELVGISFYKQIKNKSAHGAIWVKPKFRGKYSRDFLDLTLRDAFEIQELDLVYACTPWPIARNLIKKTGFKDQAKIQGVYLLTCEKDDFYEQRRGQSAQSTAKPN